MKISDLKANPKNPRKISDEKKAALQKSIDKFGDLSCVVYNVRSKQLVSGHQRTKLLPKDATIKIDKKHKNPTHSGTVAEGHIVSNGETYKFREVDWDQKTETEALLAANKHSGEWDTDLLKLNFMDFPDLDLELTGFDLVELEDMNIEIPTMDMFEEVDNETDEQYIKNHSGPEGYADRERLPDLINRDKDAEVDQNGDVIDVSEDAFSDAGKDTTVNKRHVVILDCTDDEMKRELKEKIKEIVENIGAKFF